MKKNANYSAKIIIIDFCGVVCYNVTVGGRYEKDSQKEV